MLPVIAKIEKPQAIENLDEVIAAFDGFMVARGDLGVECPLEDVPFLQKQVVQKARLNAKPVIVATQMLESMISSPAPTRAEASDVANAVLDGADAVMLSGETSVGEYPVHTVETMARIIVVDRGARHRVHGSGRVRRDRLGPAHPQRRDRQGRRGGRRAGGREVRRRVHQDRRLRAPDVPAPRSDPDPGLHPRGAGPLAARAVVGRRDVQDPDGRAHRRDGPPGRRAAAPDRPGRGGRPRRHHRREPLRASPAPPTRCASTGWATRSTRSPRPTAGADRSPLRADQPVEARDVGPPRDADRLPVGLAPGHVDEVQRVSSTGRGCRPSCS